MWKISLNDDTDESVFKETSINDSNVTGALQNPESGNNLLQHLAVRERRL